MAKATVNNNPPQTQAVNDSGGTFTTNAIGNYTYTFKTKAPASFDPTVTHAIGVSAQRNLSEFGTFDEWSETSNDVFNFVPNGNPVTVTRSVVTTDACNQCHDPLIGHQNDASDFRSLPGLPRRHGDCLPCPGQYNGHRRKLRGLSQRRRRVLSRPRPPADLLRLRS